MKLPSLVSFRYFHAAARTGSFVKAAEFLNVTHSAVSRQVRLLEDELGIELFERRNRAVFLNAAGRLLLQTTSLVFEQLEEVVYRLQQSEYEDVLTISCEPTVAMKWLIPRLADFHRRHSGIQLHLVAAGGPIDFLRTGVDLAIRRNDFQWKEAVYAVKICDEHMGPVCSKSIMETNRLEGAKLIYSGTRPDAWSVWQEQFGIQIKSGGHLEYEHFYLCIQAALSGLGMAMASFLMVQDELDNGGLYAPYGFVPDGSSYFLLSPLEIERDEKRKIFLNWLKKEVEVCLLNVKGHRQKKSLDISELDLKK